MKNPLVFSLVLFCTYLPTLLLAARTNADAGIIRALIRNGANVNATDDAGNTALLYAADRIGRIAHDYAKNKIQKNTGALGTERR